MVILLGSFALGSSRQKAVAMKRLPMYQAGTVGMRPLESRCGFTPVARFSSFQRCRKFGLCGHECGAGSKPAYSPDATTTMTSTRGSPALEAPSLRSSITYSNVEPFGGFQYVWKASAFS